MRKVIWQMMFSLDGFMAGQTGELDWHVTDDDFAEYVAEIP
jgi:dihydrofolate reductase